MSDIKKEKIVTENKISKNEIEMLTKAISKIVSTEVLEKSISEHLPLTDELPDTNKIYNEKISVLFVDMRDSTKLSDEFSKEQIVKIYRSYIRTIVQAIRYSGGVVRDFMGDGVLAIFTDDENGKSEDKAVYAARYIATVIDKILNPVLDKEIKYRISCGIGIHTGEISLSKVGMKGKEHNEDVENEFGIAWIGNITNMACKFSGAVECEQIFICTSTYCNLSDFEGKKKWSRIILEKGNNILIGYIAENYYLDLDEDVEPCIAAKMKDMTGLKESLTQEYQKQLKDITVKAEMLGKKEQELVEREKRLDRRTADLNTKEKDIYKSKEDLNKEKYDFYISVLRSGHCEKDYVKAMGREFWEENLQYAIDAGKAINKNVYEVKQEISYAMVSIYKDLEIYDKAYDFLVEQVRGCAWINVSTVKNIVNRVGLCERLKDALYKRLEKDDIDPQNKNDFVQAKKWIVFEYKK